MPCGVWKTTLSGSFCEAGLKKLETTVLVVVAAIRRLAGGGEISLSVELTRFNDAGVIVRHIPRRVARLVEVAAKREAQYVKCMQSGR